MDSIRVTKKDIILVSIISLTILLIGLVANYFLGVISHILVMVISVSVILLFIFETYRRLQTNIFKKTTNDYNQLESLFSLFFTIKPKFPVPNSREWAASPDFLKLVSEKIIERRPKYIVELGSGVSTLTTAYILRDNNLGKITSFDHESMFGEITKRNLVLHGLSDNAQVLIAPLKEYQIESNKWLWYDIHNFNPELPIDMLIIDGPPAALQDLSRYPALPLLKKYLSDSAIIILDDGQRNDEKATVKKWNDKYAFSSIEYFELEKGAFVLTL